MTKKRHEKTSGQKMGNTKIRCEDYPPEKLNLINMFCKIHNMSRASFISKLFDEFIKDNKEYFDILKKL